MPTLAARTALAALLLAPAAWAQAPSPAAPPAPARPRPAAPSSSPAAVPSRPASTPARPAGPPAAQGTARPGSAAPPQAATPRPTAPRPTPVIRPRPLAPRRPASAVQPPAPAVVPPPVPEKPAEPQKGSNTGLPLPRYATLRSNEVNLRSGPGTRYPIEWVYKRADLPVQIEREFEVWRLVRDQEGVKGWVNQATLAPKRTAIVTGAEQVMRRDPKDDASPVARLKPGVIVRLRSCEAGSPWCQTQVGDYRGWMKRADLWGVTPDEVIQ